MAKLLRAVFATNFVLFVAIVGLQGYSHAWTEKALESSDPFVFTPNNLDLDSYELDSPLVQWEWVKNSFEWVRIEKKFLVPRARARLKLTPGTVVLYHGRRFQSRDPNLEIPIVLSNEKENFILVKSNPQITIRVKMKLKADVSPKIIVDASCSNVPFQLRNVKINHSWGHLICRGIHPRDGDHYTMRVDAELMWMTEEKESAELVEGVALSHQSNAYHFDRSGDSFDLITQLPERFHPLAVSLGVGPYSHRNVNRAFGTIYAAYFFNDGMKLASFSAFPFKESPEVDTGLYLVSEQFKGMDERMVMNLLLGAHVLSFDPGGSRVYRFSAPQGAELIIRDFLSRAQNLTLGGFFYPEISGRSYINTWLRYGGAKLFYEINFIQWQETVGSGTFETKSFGLSLGFPLFRAL